METLERLKLKDLLMWSRFDQLGNEHEIDEEDQTFSLNLTFKVDLLITVIKFSTEISLSS